MVLTAYDGRLPGYHIRCRARFDLMFVITSILLIIGAKMFAKIENIVVRIRYKMIIEFLGPPGQ